ncbi:MAG: DUF3048 domain-containing protein [Actinobacteria bacterium]|nr:DUF3048 domain-containing protein [Actinomycetota bacterium]
MLLIPLLGAACNNDEPQTTSAASPSPSPSPSPEPEPVRCPLTGVEAPEGLDVNRPALAFKIDNHPRAQPPAGLEAADIVYEELVEGGLTRFLGVNHCRDIEDLGPIRSARAVDPDILVQYSPALFAHSGASPNNLRKIGATAGIVDVSHGAAGPAFSRRRGRPAPHNLFTSTEALRSRPAAQGVNGPPETGLVFDPELGEDPDEPSPEADSPSPGASEPAEPEAAAAPGTKVSLSYSGAAAVSYTYDPATRLYLRAIGGQPHLAATGDQLSATNVVVMKVPVNRSGSSPEIATAGTGEAIVLRNGEAIRGEWVRPSLAHQITLVAGGKPIALAPGSTWINLLPNDRPATVE